ARPRADRAKLSGRDAESRREPSVLLDRTRSSFRRRSPDDLAGPRGTALQRHPRSGGPPGTGRDGPAELLALVARAEPPGCGFDLAARAAHRRNAFARRIADIHPLPLAAKVASHNGTASHSQ